MAPTKTRLLVTLLLLAVVAVLQKSVTAASTGKEYLSPPHRGLLWECEAASGRCVRVMPFKEYQEKVQSTERIIQGNAGIQGGMQAVAGKVSVGGAWIDKSSVTTTGEKAFIPMGVAHVGQCFVLFRGCRLEHCHFPGMGTAAEVCGQQIKGCREGGQDFCEWQSL